MFLYLSKLLPQFIYPLGLTCLVLLVAVLVRWRPRTVQALAALALLLLWVASNRWTAAILTRSLERQHLPPAELPAADVIVLLGGGTWPAQAPRPLVEINDAGDRVLYAAHLYHQGKAPTILVTGGYPVLGRPEGATAADNMTVILEMLGVPATAIQQEKASQNTYENAVFTREMLAPVDDKRVLLVTSALHMPRSLAIFRRQGFNVTPAPTDFQVTDAGWAYSLRGGAGVWLYNTLPDAWSLYSTTMALKEYIGIMVYRWRGWL